MRISKLWVGVLACGLAGAATIERVAGGGTAAYGGPAIEVKIVQPAGVAFDKEGNWYFCEFRGQKIVKVDAKGTASIFAGTGQRSYGGDGGPAAQAAFGDPHTVAIGKDQQLYIADTANNRVRKIDLKTGVVTTVAGTGEKSFSGDGGPAVKAAFAGVYAASLSPSGERLYISDQANRRLRLLDLKSGIVTTIAGTGTTGVPQDGAMAAESPLTAPRAAAEDSKGNIYLAETSVGALRVIDVDGRIRTLIGPGTLKEPRDLCIDRDNNVIIADSVNNLIRKYTPADGKLATIVGTGEAGNRLVPNDPLQTQLNQPHGVYVHPSGDIYIADTLNNRVLRLRQ